MNRSPIQDLTVGFSFLKSCEYYTSYDIESLYSQIEEDQP